MPNTNLTMIAQLEHCRSCGRPIVWAHTPNRKAMPLDPEPTPRGNLVVSLTSDGLHAAMVNGPDRDGLRAAHRPLYLPHFTTCPHADTWRTNP